MLFEVELLIQLIIIQTLPQLKPARTSRSPGGLSDPPSGIDEGLDDHAEVAEATWTQPFIELRAIHEIWLQLRNDTASAVYEEFREPKRSLIEEALRLQQEEPATGVEPVTGSNSHLVVEHSGFEPLTSSLPAKRSSQMS